MNSPIALFLFCGFGFALSIAPSFYQWKREKRFRKLAEARLKITRSVTAMQQLLLNGTLEPGHVCHDDIFEIMRHVQRLDAYSIRWNFFKKIPQEGQLFAERVQEDLNDGKCPSFPILRDFVEGYFKAVYFRHPILLFFYRIWCLITLTTLKSILVLLKLQLAWIETKKMIQKELIASVYLRVQPQGHFAFTTIRSKS